MLSELNSQMSTSVFLVEKCCMWKAHCQDQGAVVKLSLPPFCSLLQSSLYFPRYLQIARGWVWLILIKFNLFWWSIWKSPKCCLPSVCELSDKDGWAVDHLSPSSRCSGDACVRCTLAYLHSGPHTWLFTKLWLSVHPFLQRQQVMLSGSTIRV